MCTATCKSGRQCMHHFAITYIYLPYPTVSMHVFIRALILSVQCIERDFTYVA